MATKKSPETTSGLKNAKKPINDTNAVAKDKKKKPRGKPFTSETASKVSVPFTGADDPRRNNHGQRNKEAVRLNTEMRNLYVEVLNEEYEKDGKPVGMSKLEFGIRRHVLEAIEADNLAFENVLNRTWCKPDQKLEVSGSVDKLFENGAPTVQQLNAEIMGLFKQSATGKVPTTKKRSGN